MTGNSNETATNLPQQTLNHVPAGTTKWSVQGSNLRPPVNVSQPPLGEAPPSPYAAPLKPRLSPRKDDETASASGNKTAILPRPELSVPPSVYERPALLGDVA